MASAQQKQQQALATAEHSDFAALIGREFSPKTDQAREAVDLAVKTLAEQALASSFTMSDDAYKSIEAIIGAIDTKLSEQINLILHHQDFQKLESAWRGLHHLVSNTETDDKLRIRVMDVSKEDLRRTLRRYKGIGWDQSPFFKRIYEEEYGQLGGEPYGCLVADYYFDHTPPDVELLGSLAKISAAAHAPFIAGASPSVLQMDSWQELANPRDLSKIFQNLEYAPWNSLRNSDDARYVGLAMPRFLSRLPYGIKTNPVDEFDFEEDTDGADHRKYVWSNAAYAMAVNINRSFKLYGWCTLIRGVESGGVVENLPCHTFPTDDGGLDMKCPTEIAISDRREAELSKNGFISLVHRKNTDYAAFIGAQSMQKPAEYYDADATANANLSARLPYLFACSRFAHYLKCSLFREPDQEGCGRRDAPAADQGRSTGGHLQGPVPGGGGGGASRAHAGRSQTGGAGEVGGKVHTHAGTVREQPGRALPVGRHQRHTPGCRHGTDTSRGLVEGHR